MGGFCLWIEVDGKLKCFPVPILAGPWPLRPPEPDPERHFEDFKGKWLVVDDDPRPHPWIVLGTVARLADITEDERLKESLHDLVRTHAEEISASLPQGVRLEFSAEGAAAAAS
jgi:hypothetical protein